MLWKMDKSEEPKGKKEQNSVPKYGLKLKLDHTYPENRSQNYTPAFGQICALLPLILRYIWYYLKCKLFNKSIVMDYMKPLRSQCIYGVPIGGIGCGTIGRGYRGEFCRFQLKPGIYEHNTVDANQFIVTIKDSRQETVFQSLLSTFPRKTLKSWESLIDGSKCSYTGLYPRSWTEYDLSEHGIQLTCRQISPVLPHNYKDSSLPCAVFVWEVTNLSDEEKTVTIAFTFKNGTGTKKQDKKSTCSSKAFSYNESEGVVLYHTIEKMQCAYALSVKSHSNVDISKCLYFDPNSKGSDVWDRLHSDGCFEQVEEKSHDQIFGEMAVGVAAKLKIPPKSGQAAEMSLVWYMPQVVFPKKQKTYSRKYAEQFGTVTSVVDYAFANWKRWDTAINAWQDPILSNRDQPDWFKGALFNETYYVSDGGSIWVSLDAEEAAALPKSDPRKEIGKFAYLEGHEYRMYNTYDVHFYASFALAWNWPLLQQSLQYDMRDAIFTEIKDRVKMLYDGKVVKRKKPNSVPHDIGDPGEEPFILLNSYPIHDVSEWRDLNVKFVLQVFRDAFIHNVDEPDVSYLTDMYEACKTVMIATKKFDSDNDGLIENSGQPDQTFDTWVMLGTSAYCGGLWLAALFAMTEFARVLGKKRDEDAYSRLLAIGRVAFERKLWNGKYYNFDCSRDQKTSIMADQLCGHWYLRCTGYNYEVFREERVKSALKTIYENNVKLFCDGKMGAVNGFMNEEVDDVTIQSLEVWTGVTYALAASLIQEGLVHEGFRTAKGMYESMTQQFGLAFDTPEALYAEKYYRAVGYMRPLSIWSMQIAFNNLKKST